MKTISENTMFITIILEALAAIAVLIVPYLLFDLIETYAGVLASGFVGGVK